MGGVLPMGSRKWNAVGRFVWPRLADDGESFGSIDSAPDVESLDMPGETGGEGALEGDRPEFWQVDFSRPRR